MPEARYTLERLRTHSASIRAKATCILRSYVQTIDEELRAFSDFVDALEGQPASLQRNVKLMLACKFLNHVYSALVLAENGLIVDAILCERNALETVAFHWLVCLDSNAAEAYNRQEIPRPVEVRTRLENLGVDISHLPGLYASSSEVSHVGRPSERFHSDWTSPLDGKLLFAGSYSPEDQTEMFTFLPALLCLFKEPLMDNAS
jgi:hypothetical protein